MGLWCGAGKLRELRSSLYVKKRLAKTFLRLAILPVKTAHFTPFSQSGMKSHSEIAPFN